MARPSILTAADWTRRLTAPLSTSAANYRVIVDGPNAYVAAGAGGVVVIDVSNPTTPREKSRIPLPGLAKELILENGRLVVASSDAGLFILEESGVIS